MIRHLLKLNWKRRQSNVLLLLEFLLTFLSIFAIMVFVYSGIGNTLKPLGFEYKKVMTVVIQLDTLPKDQMRLKINQIKKNIEALPGIAGVSLSRSPVPFTKNQGDKVDIKYQGKIISAYKWPVDHDFKKVMNLSINVGRWFVSKDLTDARKPIIINSYLKETLFPNEDPIGKYITLNNEKRNIIGVVNDFRTTSRTGTLEGFFEIYSDHDAWFSGLVKFKKHIEEASYQNLIRVSKPFFINNERKRWNIQTLNHFREVESAQYAIPVAIMSIVCAFLILNVVLGLFSILRQNINQRKMEIGIRRAVGAFASQIYSQIIVEVVLLVTVAMIPAGLLAFQLALFKAFNTTHFEYFISFVISAALIYFMVILCAIYPSRLAAQIQPAESLHEE